MSRRLDLTPWARDAIADEARDRAEDSARQLGVYIAAGGGSSSGPWTVKVRGHGQYVELHGYGALEAVIAGALDDFQELPV